jgi:SpoVK/Ycf46/Vps4 family AAA+-type ATPase
VYVIATANQVQSLPPEFTRKGRFDEIYGLDLPDTLERKEIFRIHLFKRNRKPENFSIDQLAEATKGYTGADIEMIVKLSLKIAFAENNQLETIHLDKAISAVIPLSKTETGRIEEIKQWCSRHARAANSPTKNAPQKTNERKISLS